MAVNLPIQFEADGDAPAYVAADGSGHVFANSRGNVNLWILNTGDATFITVTSYQTPGLPTFSDKVVTIPASTLYKTQSFSERRFTDRATGLTSFTVDRISGVSIAAVAAQQIFRD